MAQSSIAMCSLALIKIGAGGLSSFDDGTAEAEVAANLYPGVRDALLSSYPWSFATGQVRLARLTEDPVADFSYAYQLPVDFLRALSVGTGDRGDGVTYRIRQNRLHTDAENITLTYIFRPDSLAWPAFFDQVVIGHLAAEFCIPVTESAARGEALARVAKEDLKMAKTIDAQQQTPQAVLMDGLLEARL